MFNEADVATAMAALFGISVDKDPASDGAICSLVCIEM